MTNFNRKRIKDALIGIYSALSLMGFFGGMGFLLNNSHYGVAVIMILASAPGIVFWIYKIRWYAKQ